MIGLHVNIIISILLMMKMKLRDIHILKATKLVHGRVKAYIQTIGFQGTISLIILPFLVKQLYLMNKEVFKQN